MLVRAPELQTPREDGRACADEPAIDAVRFSCRTGEVFASFDSSSGVCDRLYSLPFFILPKNESKRTSENCKNFIKKLYILILSGET